MWRVTGNQKLIILTRYYPLIKSSILKNNRFKNGCNGEWCQQNGTLKNSTLLFPSRNIKVTSRSHVNPLCSISGKLRLTASKQMPNQVKAFSKQEVLWHFHSPGPCPRPGAVTSVVAADGHCPLLLRPLF